MAHPRTHLAIVLLTGCVVLMVVYARCGTGLIGAHDDDWDYLHQARLLVRGEGFASLWTHPVNLAVESAPAEHFHNLWKPPGMAVLLVPWFWLSGSWPSVLVCTLLSAVSLLGSAVIVWSLGRRHGGATAAVLAGVLVVTNGRLLLFAPRVLSELPFALVFTGALATLAGARALPRFVAVGALLGGAMLLRTNVVFFLPGILLFVGLTDRRRAPLRTVAILGAMAAVYAPWAIRNALLTGDPLFNTSSLLPLMFTSKYPEWTLFQGLERPSLVEFASQHPLALASKYVHYATYYATRLPLLAGAITPLIAVLLFDATAPPVQRRLAWALVAMLLVQMTVLSAYEMFLRVFYGLIPIMVLLAMWGGDRLRILLSRRGRSFGGDIVALLVVITLAESAMRVYTARPVADPQLPERCRAVASAVGHDEVIATDMPDAMAWWGDTRTILVPHDADTLQRVHTRYVRVGAVYVEQPEAWLSEDLRDRLSLIVETGARVGAVGDAGVVDATRSERLIRRLSW